MASMTGYRSEENIPADGGLHRPVTDPLVGAVAQRIERLRINRVRPDRAAPASSELQKIARNLRRDRVRLAGVGGAFLEHCPPRLAARAGIASLNHGVLTITADDSPTRFELDRWLRNGGDRLIISNSRAAIARVKVVVAPPGFPGSRAGSAV